jgi:preprotein translocase subunit SecF
MNVGEKITASLNAKGLDATLQRSEIMGSQVGEELINDGGLGLLAAFAAVFLYVAVRFQTKFSIAAIAALIHDVIIVLGFFSVFQFEVDLTVLAAVLAIIGYSINDTIVVADRIRENFRRMRDVTTVELFNVSLTETLGRTIMTSGTTLLTVIALFLFGGDLIHNFSSALLVGITVGTYSSVYISAAILLWLNVSKEDLMPPEKEGAELDQTP